MTSAIPMSGAATEPGFEIEVIDSTYDGPDLQRITLHNGLGISVALFNRGATIQGVVVPDRDGLLADVTLGFDWLGEYVRDNNYFGALVGRYANRIADGRFTLDGVEHRLATNNGPNHLHGGPTGFHTREWETRAWRDGDDVGVTLSLTSADGEEGYPGQLETEVQYIVTPAGELICDYRARTTRPTPVNITQHAYWNLAGHDVGDVLDHELTVRASHYLPVSDSLIPLDTVRPVEGTAFDFQDARTIGELIDSDDAQVRIAHGYDHNFILDAGATDEPTFAARLHEPGSGRVLEIYTTEPGLQVYSGNMIPRDLPGKGGAKYRRHSGIALETQKFPDSPNRPEFPSALLSPGEEYHSRTVHRFLIAR